MKFDVRKCLIDWAMNEWMYVWMDGCTNEDEVEVVRMYKFNGFLSQWNEGVE